MAGLPDDTRPEPVDLLAALIAETRDRTERGAVLGARDDIDQAMTANYRLTGDVMSKPEEFAEDNGAGYREEVGWGHKEGSFLVHCYRPTCSAPDAPHGKFTRWVIQSPWEMEGESA